MKAVSAAIRASAKRFFRRGESLQCIPSVLRWPLRLPSVAHRKMSGPYLSRRWYSPRMLLVDLLARASFSNALQRYEKKLRLPWICSFLVVVWRYFFNKSLPRPPPKEGVLFWDTEFFLGTSFTKFLGMDSHGLHARNDRKASVYERCCSGCCLMILQIISIMY